VIGKGAACKRKNTAAVTAQPFVVSPQTKLHHVTLPPLSRPSRRMQTQQTHANPLHVLTSPAKAHRGIKCVSDL
jgi:hypothetical protein